MNPYISNPIDIPQSDPYSDMPLYGRYCPGPEDFHVDTQHINSSSEESLRYWATVVGLCTESNMIFPADEGRDVFAVGSVIVKSSHRHQEATIDYSYADANEVQAIAIARSVLKRVRVPDIYFSGKINGRAVLIQERLPGVGLNVALPYLSDDQRKSFKLQAREILRQLHSIKALSSRQSRDHIVPDPNILTNGRLNPQEAHILFSANHDQDMSFMHNDFTPSNCIVNDDKIVGLIDWEMAGYLGWDTAGEVHRKIRSPQREHYVHANLSEEELQNMMWWNDLYDDDCRELESLERFPSHISSDNTFDSPNPYMISLEAIGVASGLVGLATFAGQCNVALYQTVTSCQSHQQRVCDLMDETCALGEVLHSLAVTARANPELRIPALEIPLKRCAKACQEFELEIKKFSSRSDEKRTSFRDWARLRYMGEDVDGFRRLLSGYKMTITVALTYVNLRKSVVSAEAIQGHLELLITARADLEDRLEMIDDKLDLMLSKSLDRSESLASEVAQIKEERQSTENCLKICSQLSEHITQIQLANSRTRPRTDSNAESSSMSERITNEGLEACKETLSRMTSKLASHEKQLFNHLAEKMSTKNSSPEVAADIVRLKDEWESARQSMDLLSSANSQLEKSVSVIENHATGDAIQFMVSTKGKILNGKNRGLGWRTRQVGGYLDDETVTQISRDMNHVSFHNVSETDQSPQQARDAEFKERYGDGFKLTQPQT